MLEMPMDEALRPYRRREMKGLWQEKQAPRWDDNTNKSSTKTTSQIIQNPTVSPLIQSLTFRKILPSGRSRISSLTERRINWSCNGPFLNS